MVTAEPADEDESEYEDESDSDEVLLVSTVFEPHERYVSIEELEEGYGGDGDGPDFDGYTAQERELREIGGVAGMSMEIVDAEMPEPGEGTNDDSLDDWHLDDYS